MEHGDDNPRGPGADRQADQRLVHALLLHVHDDRAAEHRERRVQTVLRAVRESAGAAPTSKPALASPAPRVSPLRVWAVRGAWAAAAMVLMAAGVLLVITSQTPAGASLNDILGALSRPGDRTFHIQVEPLMPEIQHRVGLNGATLYLRDGRQFLLVRVDPRGGSLFDGYDGRQSWRICDGVVVETKEGHGAGGLGMPQAMSDALFVDLQQTLERIRVDYTVERLDQAPLPSGGTLLRHVLARRNSREVKGPAAIEIWADLKTGMPRRIVFDQGKFQGNPQPRRLTFDLAGEEPLPADWFSYTAHQARSAAATDTPGGPSMGESP
ncbi:MAG: hypothetical protein NTZ98_08560 [Acidobacteria bacterium]|nr:hypothetical protein [Acidobacteriota bacterium]